LVTVTSWTARAAVAVLHPLLALAHTCLAPVLFLIAPLAHAARLLWAAAFRQPYALLHAAGTELYGVWVFVGVALTLGVLLGLATRSIARGATHVFLALGPDRALSAMAPVAAGEPVEPARRWRGAAPPPLARQASGASPSQATRREWRRMR
jgi:hypothetical protein